nr:MAG TPA: hypothetical protein [Caudoviricetes sp.]
MWLSSVRMVAIFCMMLTNCYISQILIQNFSKSFFQVKKSVSLQH